MRRRSYAYRKRKRSAYRIKKRARSRTRVFRALSKKPEIKSLTVLLTGEDLGPSISQDFNWVYGGGLTDQPDSGGYIVKLIDALRVKQGVTNHERVGNRIVIKSCMIKGYVMSEGYRALADPVTLQPANPYTEPFTVSLVAYKYKTGNDETPQYLKQRTNLTMGPVESTAKNQLLPWNTEAYKFLKFKRFKLKGPTTAYTDVLAASGQPADNVLLENPVTGDATNPMFRTFKFRLPTARVWVFSDGNDIARNTWANLGVYSLNASGSGPDAREARARIYMTATLRYTDA